MESKEVKIRHQFDPGGGKGFQGFGQNLFSVFMPYRARENLFIDNISNVANIFQKESAEITHILSIFSSISISFFFEWRSSLVIPTKEIKKVYVGGSDSSGAGLGSEDASGRDGGSKISLLPKKLLYSSEYAGKDLKMAGSSGSLSIGSSTNTWYGSSLLSQRVI